jgi:hypothetical protein
LADGNRTIRLYFFVCMSVLFLTLGVWDLYFTIVSEHWPTAPGRITESYVTAPRRDSRAYGVWHLNLKYEFIVNGVLHTGGTYRFGGESFFSQKAAYVVAGRYSPGEEVKVFYDSSNPDRTVLVPGVESDSWVEFTFCTLGLVGLVYCSKALFTRSRADAFHNAENTSLHA